jgi:putative membrane protein
MPPSAHMALNSWTFPLSLTLVTVLAAFVYIRGWLQLRSASINAIRPWHAASFLFGLLLIWVALDSPLAALDHQLLTVHMAKHLLLMTFAPPLVLLGAPIVALFRGLPHQFVQSALIPLLQWPSLKRIGHFLTQPTFCWLAATAALVGWHIPAAFGLALHSHTWHAFENISFLATGFLFWWPVVQPWPSVPSWSRWSILLYLFLATLPCDILSGFLVFSERVVYPVYLSTPRSFGLSVLGDQELAGALMWTCVTVVYLVPAAILTTWLLAPRSHRVRSLPSSELASKPVPHGDSQRAEAI